MISTLIDDLESVCDDIFKRWDKDQRSGKLLAALAGRVSGYDPRVTRIRAALEAANAPPDWFYCDIDPDEAGDSAYAAMFQHRPRLTPIVLRTSYLGPTLYGVMAPPHPEAENDEETAHVFDTEEEALAFCEVRRAALASTTADHNEQEGG